MIAVTGLAGFALASDKSLATLPLTAYVRRLRDNDDPGVLFS